MKKVSLTNTIRLSLAISVCAVHLGVLPTAAWSSSSTTHPEDLKKQAKIQKMYRGYKFWSFRRAKDITVPDVLALDKDKQVIFVDVRAPEEQAVSMIAQAIPYQEFDRVKDEYKDAVIIAYCTIGSRSGQYTEELMKEGFEVYNLIGGILSWAHAGQPLYHKGQAVNRAHVYGRRWDLLPESYNAIY
jgi:rhodanese-related sulfurtransferase